MLDTLDSRALRLTDCYGQRFMNAGTYPCGVFPVGGDRLSAERPLTVKVVEGKSQTKMSQRAVVIRYQQGKFTVDPKELTIETGDMLLWHCSDRGAPPYVVVGDKEFFASNRLVNESGYSHAFGLPGKYEWMDAYGSGASGVITVKDPGCKDPADFQRWHKSLSKGTLVTITDGRSEPKAVEVVVGQTVFFAVTKGPGISITDRRLLAQPEGPRDSGTIRKPASKAKR